LVELTKNNTTKVYHYFYVRFPIDSSKPIQQSIFDLGSALNQALDLTQGSEQTKQQHIAAVVLVKGIPFYGYHNQHETFLKIHMVNPYEKQRMIDLLQSGVINDTKYQPFEAHINFDLQFLIDHNLYGMDWMYVNDSRKSGTQFRLPLSPEPMVDCTQSDDCLLYLSHTVPKHLQSDLIKKASYSELELDIMGMSILNRLSVKERDIHNSLYDVVSQQEGQKKKYLKSLESIWKEETTRLGEYEQASEFSTLRTSQYIPWIVEGNLRKNMERMMSGTTLQSPNKDEPILENIKTAFQSIEELYPEEYNDLQKEENQSLAHKMDEPHSFMGFPSMDLDLPAKRASQNIGSQQNRSQPDLFSASQAQPSLLNSDIMKSFILEAEKSQGAMQEEAEEEVNQSDEENGDEADFSIIYGGNDAEEEDIIKWINKIDKEREEKTTCRNPVNIEYEDDIVISEIPPVDQQTLYLREVKKRYRINQLDGADDDDDGSSDHKKTPDDEWKRISRANRNEKLMLLKKRRAQIEKKRSKVKVGQYKVSVVISEKDSILSRLENMRKAPKASKKRKRLLISDSESSEKEEEERKEEKKIKNERPIIEEKSSNEDLQSIPNPAMMSSQKSTESLQYFTKHIDAMWSPQCSSESQSHTNSDDFFKRNNPTPGSPILTRKKPFFQSQPSSHIMDYDLGDQDFLHSEKSVSPIASQRESQLSQHIYPSTVDSDADIQVPLDSDLENWSIVQQTVANEKDSTPKITKTIDQLPSTESREFVCSVPPPVMDPNVKLPVVYKEPFYSKTEDVPRYPTVFSGKEFKLVSNSVKYLKEFQTKFTKKPDISRNLKSPHLFLEQTNIQSWTPTKDPPTLKDAEKWLEEQSEKPSKKTKVDPTSQVSDSS
jgi:hypothetical protein